MRRIRLGMALAAMVQAAALATPAVVATGGAAGATVTISSASGAAMAGIRSGGFPQMRWDHRPEARDWTLTAMGAVLRHDDALTATVPQDIDTWCPGYATAPAADRRAFWVGILSALAKHESTWNPRASGGGGKWIGLTQIAPPTARAYGCVATTRAALQDGSANLSCALRIAAVQVPKDGMVAGNGRQGLGRDWAPFRSAAKRREMAAWTRTQSYCQPGRASAGALSSPAVTLAADR